jgi:hypothetical protein
MTKNKILREIIEEALVEVLREQAVLQTSSQEILGKFPTLRKTLTALLTTEFESFVQEVQWIAPKPTTFRVVLKNNDHFFMKWMGKGFEAQIAGKKYYLGSLPEYQQALDKLNELLRYEPIGVDKETEPADGGDFDTEFSEPGLGGGGAPSDIEEPTEPGLEGGDEVEFEEPAEEPET